MTRIAYPSLSRRNVLIGGIAAVLLSTTSFTFPAAAETVVEEPMLFDFDSFSARMRDLAQTPYVPASFVMPEGFDGLGYDSYRLIQFRPDRGYWADEDYGYQVQAFHLGWLYPEPVRLFEIREGVAEPIAFGPEDFDYRSEDLARAAQSADEFPGVAGFRLNYPLNRPEALDELISFLGASYFRALGRDNIYGLSARGLVIDSWTQGAEEFPTFTEFYLERPTGPGPLVVYAAMQSPSVTGAYRFEIDPGGEDRQETIIDVTARLYFREDVGELGVAPLTSMFLFDAVNRSDFDDYRPQVHDSNGLSVTRESGEVLWRPLLNTASLGNSYLWENNPKAFGLYQRGRRFEDYQDAGAHYERRPSVRVEPVGEWGQGHVRLVEIPARLEADDNIVAFWIPAEPARKGEEREFRYRLIWGDLDPRNEDAVAHVIDTRTGQGGVSGVENAETLRKFVVDFAGDVLDGHTIGATVDVYTSISSGTIVSSTLSELPATGNWRLVLDVEIEGSDPVELKAYLIEGGRALTESWLFQWRPAS